MSKLRSPNYPQLSLGDAIERVRRIYAAEHTHPTPKEVLVQHLGYGTLNGASATIIGALNRYGLLENTQNGLKVSDIAVAIMELPEGDPERDEALLDAAFRPQLFAELRSQFGTQLPSVPTLKHTLIKQGFLPKAAEDAITVYRANLMLFDAAKVKYNGEEMEENTVLSQSESPQPPMPGTAIAHAVVRRMQTNPDEDPESSSILKFKISTASEAKIVFNGPVTQEAIAKLVAILELSKDTYPTKAEIEKQRASQLDEDPYNQ